MSRGPYEERSIAPPQYTTDLVAPKMLAALPGEDHFWAALACALLFHAAFLLAVATGQPPRAIGDPAGSPGALNVEIIDASDLAYNPPAASASITQPAPVSQDAAPASPANRAPEPASPEAQDEAPTKSAPVEPDTNRLFTLPTPAPTAPIPPSASRAKPKPQTQSQTQASLDLSPPANALKEAAAASRQATATRPPGTTRSGQNDEFGRGVIRALRVTMPPPSGSLDRVTIRIVLSENGDATDVKVVRRSKDPILDQSVVFSTKQASFPLPPAGSTTIDRTFLVTYIYN